MNTRDQVTNFVSQFSGKPLSPELISAFYKGIAKEFDVSLHPDDDFNDYVYNSTQEPIFQPYEADILNKISDKMFEYCNKNNLDIYDLAIPDSSINFSTNRGDNETKLMGEKKLNEYDIENPPSYNDEYDEEDVFNSIFPYAEKEITEIAKQIKNSLLQNNISLNIKNIELIEPEVKQLNNGQWEANFQYKVSFDKTISSDLDSIMIDIADSVNVSDANKVEYYNIENNELFILVSGQTEEDDSYMNESNYKTPRMDSDKIEEIFEGIFLSKITDIFSDMTETNQEFSQNSLHNPGDFVVEANDKSVFIDIKLTPESFNNFEHNTEEVIQWFKHFCDSFGLSSTNSDVLSDDQSQTVLFEVKWDSGVNENIITEEDNQGNVEEAMNIMRPYFQVAIAAKNMGKITSIMDSAMKDPESYDNDVYFTIVFPDGVHDMIQYDKISNTVVLYQDLNSQNVEDDDISLEGFKKYVLSE